MRVNHTGEICAQALYYGQMAMARSPLIREILAQAASEETDHLAWTAQRLQELSSHRSYLNFFWYSQAYLLGLIGGNCRGSLESGFYRRNRAASHPSSGRPFKPLAGQRCEKPQNCRANARRRATPWLKPPRRRAAKPLPGFIKLLMSWQAKVMTCVAAKL